MTASLLPHPADPRFTELVLNWPRYEATPGLLWPRSAWLSAMESLLRELFPLSNSASRKLTARHYAPFPLAAGHDVP